MHSISPFAELSQRLLDASQQGQTRLAELRAAADGSLVLHQELLGQVQALLASRSASESGGSESGGSESGGPDLRSQEELEDLRSELEWTRKQLLAAREQLESSPAAAVAELEEQLADVRDELETARRQAAEASRRASNDAEHDGHQLQDMEERLEQLAQRLAERDQQLAERDQQLAERDQQLAERVDAGPVGRSPELEAVVNADEIVEAERLKLRHLQEEWHEKLRAAELEISVERARIARQRAQMEERVQVLERELEGLREGAATPGGKRESGGGRWFARLGLNRED